MEHDKKKRSLAKAISYRLLMTGMTFAIVFSLTGKITLALGAGIIEIFAKFMVYYLHERAWQNVSWGR